MRSAGVTLLAGCGFLFGCRSEPAQNAVIGDGVPRANGSVSFLTVVQSAVDSTAGVGTRVLRWSPEHSDLLGGEVIAAEQFARTPGMVAVIGHSGSKNTLIVSPTYRDAGIPLIVPTATSRALLDAGSHVFMLAPTDRAEGAFIAQHALDSLHATRIAILYVADAYGNGINDGVKDALTRRGAKLIESIALSGRECTYDSLAIRGIARSMVRRSRPDLVVLALAPQLTACAIRELFAADARLRILTADSYDPKPDEWRQLSAQERAAVSCVRFWEPSSDSLSNAFVQRAERVLHRPPNAGEALAYDGFMLVATAIHEGHRTPRAVMRWLRELGTSARPAFRGVTGPIAFLGDRSGILRVRSLADTARFQ